MSATVFIDLHVARAVELFTLSTNAKRLAIQIGRFDGTGAPNFQAMLTMGLAAGMSIREAFYSQKELIEAGFVRSERGDRHNTPPEARRGARLRQKGYACRGLCGALKEQVDAFRAAAAKKSSAIVARANAKAAEWQQKRLEKRKTRQAENEKREQDRAQRKPDPNPPPAAPRQVVQAPPDNWRDLFPAPKTVPSSTSYAPKPKPPA